VRGKNFGEETIKKALMTMSLSIIVFLHFLYKKVHLILNFAQGIFGELTRCDKRANGTENLF
jgi:hypothetical protein